MTAQRKTASLAAAGVALTSIVAAAESGAVDEVIEKIKSKDDAVRGPAWQGAGKLGAPAVKPLAEIMASSDDMEIARSAKRALWRIVRYAGRPTAEKERQAVQEALTPLLQNSSTAVKREVLWMLSEIGDDHAIEPMAALLKDTGLREDARQCLQRIPLGASLTALKKAFAAAPEEFKYNLAHSLRMRGQKVAGYPSQRLIPNRQTSVKQGTS